MKKTALAILFLGALPLAAAADVTKEDIIKLVQGGVSDGVILTFIRAKGPVRDLSADEIVELSQAGASDAVLSALATRPVPAPAPRIVVERPEPVVVERPVYVERPVTTVVYERPVYYTPPVTYVSSPCYTPTYSYYHPPSFGFSYYRSSGSRYCGSRSGWGVGWGW